MEKCCNTKPPEPSDAAYEILHIEKTQFVCPLCEDYSKQQSIKPIAVVSCEGACLRGEISRQAANNLCYSLIPQKTARVCLGGAFTKDGGQRNLVRTSKHVVVIEGCSTKCASRMLKAIIPENKLEVIVADSLCDFNENLFSVNEMHESEIKTHAKEVAEKIAGKL